MNFSEYSKLNFVERKAPIKNIIMSHIPMFDQSHGGKSFYKTTYGEDFHLKENHRDNSYLIGRNPDFTINNAYDFNELSDRLVRKNSANKNTQKQGNYFNDSKFYKRPQIPDYIKRDNFYQTNTEKNIEYLQTVNGLMPILKSNSKQNHCMF